MFSTLNRVELRAQEGRAVLVGEDGSGAREIDAHYPALPLGLSDALREWAQVADAVIRSGHRPSVRETGDLVSRRGEQLARRLAGVIGRSIRYADPLGGEIRVVDVPQVAEDLTSREWRQATEPTPWGTGLAVSAFAGLLVLVAVVSVSLGLGESSRWLAFAANVLIGSGLAPSVWLLRRVPVWRWVAYGVAAGLGLAWVGLVFTLLG